MTTAICAHERSLPAAEELAYSVPQPDTGVLVIQLSGDLCPPIHYTTPVVCPDCGANTGFGGDCEDVPNSDDLARLRDAVHVMQLRNEATIESLRLNLAMADTLHTQAAEKIAELRHENGNLQLELNELQQPEKGA